MTDSQTPGHRQNQYSTCLHVCL